MIFKYPILFCVVLFFVHTDAFVNRNVAAPTASPNALSVDSLKKNMDAFKNCIDQSLAGVVGDVNEKQLQPLFTVIGDSLNRFSKAFEDLTAPGSSLTARSSLADDSK